MFSKKNGEMVEMQQRRQSSKLKHFRRRRPTQIMKWRNAKCHEAVSRDGAALLPSLWPPRSEWFIPASIASSVTLYIHPNCRKRVFLARLLCYLSGFKKIRGVMSWLQHLPQAEQSLSPTSKILKFVQLHLALGLDLVPSCGQVL